MSEIMKQADYGITVIDTGYLREKFAASHMLVADGEAAFIDVGTSFSAARLLQALGESGLAEGDVRYIILTHIHLDHAGGAGRLMTLFPKAQLVVHPKGARHIIDPEKLVAGSIAVYGKEIYQQLYGEIPGVPKERVIAADDGYVLDLAGRKLHIMDTPGHARHHLCVWDPASSGVFTGDALGLAYGELQIAGRPPFFICTTSPSAFEPDAMIASIERVMSLAPSRFYLTHYGPVAAVPESVAALMEMVRGHKRLGEEYGDNPVRLRQELALLIEKAYADYLRGQPPQVDIAPLLRNDVELNAQGIELWAARRQG